MVLPVNTNVSTTTSSLSSSKGGMPPFGKSTEGYSAMRGKPKDIGGINGGGAGVVPYYRPPFIRDNNVSSGKTTGRYGNLSGGRSGQDGLTSTGNNPIMSQLGSTGMFSKNPLIKETPGFQSNHRVVSAKLIRPTKQKYLGEQHKYVLMISAKENNVRSKGDKLFLTRKHELEGEMIELDGAEILMPSFDKRYNQVSIPAWNMMQQKRECKPSMPSDVLTAEELWNDWYIEGPVVTEEGENPVRGMGRSKEISKERLINSVVRGYAYTFMIWPPHQPLTKLYLILKKVKSDGVYVLNPQGNESVIVPGVGTILTDKPFTLVPWCDSQFDTPPLEVLKYTDEFGIEHSGKYIYVGRSCYGLQSNNLNSYGTIEYEITSHMTQHQSHIFMDA